MQRGGQQSRHDGPGERQRQHAVGGKEREEHVPYPIPEQTVAQSRCEDLRGHRDPGHSATVLQVTVRARVLAHHHQSADDHLDAREEAEQHSFDQVHPRGRQGQVQHEQGQLGHHVQNVHDHHRLPSLAQEVALVQALEVPGLEGVAQRGEDDPAVRVAPAQEEVWVAGRTVDLQETQVTARALGEDFSAAVVVTVAHRRPAGGLFARALRVRLVRWGGFRAVLVNEALLGDVSHGVLP